MKFAAVAIALIAMMEGPARAAGPQGGCIQVVVEREIARGQGAEVAFAKGPGGDLKLVVQPLASGWIVRVVPAKGPWMELDRAALATPPYGSPSPLLLSTDYAFRAQDAIAWNPRRFRYVASAATADALAKLYPKVMAEDAKAAAEVGEMVASQPEGTIEILDAELAPGTADQWRMAAAVATHLESTPHREAKGVAASKLGMLTSVKLRVSLELAEGWTAMAGVAQRKIPCMVRPTVRGGSASQ